MVAQSEFLIRVGKQSLSLLCYVCIDEMVFTKLLWFGFSFFGKVSRCFSGIL